MKESTLPHNNLGRHISPAKLHERTINFAIRHQLRATHLTRKVKDDRGHGVCAAGSNMFKTSLPHNLRSLASSSETRYVISLQMTRCKYSCNETRASDLNYPAISIDLQSFSDRKHDITVIKLSINRPILSMVQHYDSSLHTGRLYCNRNP
ncbi:ATP citrate lyase subunit B 2 [Striga asiatica]|uniref:ATP citrate lyase subunit B 2 n=1 Tax=Striga asiatica TaxID=4170 RepID=A0A5A7PII1_STRAF|nr:ATP citrate lyase subunit B 2 [Striga asiatica]